MERAPDAVLLPFLSRLRARREELAWALGGRSLRTELVLHLAGRRLVYRIVFTAAGHVELTGAYDFDPRLRFEGSAVYEQVPALHASPNELRHYPAVRAVLGEEAAACRSSHT